MEGFGKLSHSFSGFSKIKTMGTGSLAVCYWKKCPFSSMIYLLKWPVSIAMGKLPESIPMNLQSIGQ